ncbi:MAG TPA: 50S ribosomal protein L5 [Patescibacteria group bacterium]|nr:50S ribosomal protein L5 [Patescibacteria group bacterium]
MDNLQSRYNKTITKDLQVKLNIVNPMAVPAIKKIVLNMGVKDAVVDKKNIERAASAMTQISGQKPKIVKARKSIATFKLREGDQIGVTVTLRGKRMYEFLEKVIDIVLPRIKDFHGVSKTSFDGRGNYTLGFSEYTVFPEIDPSTVERMQGMEMVVVTSAKDNQAGLSLLEALGMPFTKEGK